MTIAASLIILCALGIGSLVAVSLVNSRQARAQRARRRIKMLTFQVDALEEPAILLDRIVDNRLIVHHMYDEALTLLDAMQKLDPNTAYLQATVFTGDSVCRRQCLQAGVVHAQRRASEFADQDSTRAINRARESDTKIARTKQALNEADEYCSNDKPAGKLTHRIWNCVSAI